MFVIDFDFPNLFVSGLAFGIWNLFIDFYFYNMVLVLKTGCSFYSFIDRGFPFYEFIFCHYWICSCLFETLVVCMYLMRVWSRLLIPASTVLWSFSSALIHFWADHMWPILSIIQKCIPLSEYDLWETKIIVFVELVVYSNTSSSSVFRFVFCQWHLIPFHGWLLCSLVHFCYFPHQFVYVGWSTCS